MKCYANFDNCLLFQDIQSNVVTSLPEEEPKKPRVKRVYKNVRHKDFCYFCECEVLNFARHIFRNHKGETDIQKILLMETNSTERKRAIAALRKQGNFIKNSITLFKPVHRSYVNDTDDSYINCPFCLGFYSRKRLWKHKKECPKKMENKMEDMEINNLLANKYGTDFNLKTKVFSRMIADKISLTVQKDPLICSFGSQYLSNHREQHHINICSRKMRELGKVLLECKKIKPQIQNSFQLLHPQMFDTIVQSVKFLAKYNPQKDMFMSPTFAMNISRSLKDLCDIAIHFILKRKHNYLNISSAEAEVNINTFRNMIENTWKHVISSKAGHDLNTKTWNKVTIVPLAADLKLFRTYLIERGNYASKQLKISKSLKQYILLMETAFCRLLLLNRRRVGELQRLKLSTYMLANDNTRQNYEEFAEAVTSTEQVLLKKFKRIVTRGKRGRGVPILFSTDIQDHIQLLIELRQSFLKKENEFLFANPNSDQSIVGYKVIQKHARLSGAKNPDALTSTKLRKHLATLTQIFNMTAVEVEQLATFMGHSTDVHKQVYRLPDDIFQTAKIAKILLLMEKGEAGLHKGKSLEDIEVNLDEEIQEEDEVMEESLQNIQENITEEASVKKIEESRKPVTHTKPHKRKLVPWTNEQKQIVLEFFENHIKNKKPPRRAECETLKENYNSLLNNKDWLKIKVFVQNAYTRNKDLESYYLFFFR